MGGAPQVAGRHVSRLPLHRDGVGGGYPEAVFSAVVQANPRRYIRSDIIDKVLLRDLPSLDGIADIQKLNSLFDTLAYNSAQELGMEELSQTSHVAKNTLGKYLASTSRRRPSSNGCGAWTRMRPTSSA